MKKVNIKIEYTARKDERYDKAFKPILFVNGKWHYTTARCKKTMRGALNSAKRMAEQCENDYPAQYNNVTITQR
jgi:hypothetical protein